MGLFSSKKQKKSYELSDLPCQYCSNVGLEYWDEDGWLLWCPCCGEKFRYDYYMRWYRNW